MKKKANLLLTLAVVLISLICLPRKVPASETGSLTINYIDGEATVPGAEFDIWRIADGNGTMTEDFSGSGVLLDSSLNNSEWIQAAADLQAYASEKMIPPLATGVTDENGTLVFSNLENGFYLIAGGMTQNGPLVYTAQTFLINVNGDTVAEPKFSTGGLPTLDSFAYAGGYDPDMNHRTKQVYEDPDTTITDEVYLSGLVPGDEYELRSVILNDTYDFGFPVPALFNGSSMKDNYGSELGDAAESLVMSVFDAWGIPYPDTPGNEEVIAVVSAEGIPEGAPTWHPDGMWFDLPAAIDEEKIAALTSNPEYADLLKLIAFQKQSFTATEENMTVSSIFEHLNTLNKGGQDLRVFQILSKDHFIVATEVVAQYERETVHVVPVEIDTEATVNGVHEAEADREVILKDTVSYSGVAPGKEYRLEGSLTDPETGEVLDGQTVSMTFVPEADSGSVEQEFTFDASGLAGKSVVVFETLYRDDYELETHKDPVDKDQTVLFTEKTGETLTGSLTVSKEVTGIGDTEREWHFTVTLNSKLNGEYGEMVFEDGVSEIVLKHGETLTATGLPVGTEYAVAEAEADQDGYVTTAEGDTGVISEDGALATFVNDLPDKETTPSPEPTEEPKPTETPKPTEEPKPTETPKATGTPKPAEPSTTPETSPAPEEKPTDVPPNPTGNPAYEKGTEEEPDTGDRSGIDLWMVLLAVSLTCAGTVCWKKRKEW